MSALAPRAKYPTFKFDHIGAKAEGVIIEPPVDSQAKKFGTDVLDFWPDGQPIMQTKIVLRQEDGTETAVYAKGRMAKAITGAIIEARATDLEVGGRLSVEFNDYGDGKNPANPPKEYGASYVPPRDRTGQDDEAPF